MTDTMPMSLDAFGSQLDEFRLTGPVEIGGYLKRLVDGSVHVGLNAANGVSITATIWTTDAGRGQMSFSLVTDEPQLDAIVESDDITVVAYLDAVKLQFDVGSLVAVRGSHGVALKSSYPRSLYRFQRRCGFRVRPLLRNSPVAQIRHPMIPEMQVALRIVDVSIGGCALFLPADVPPLEPGVLINGVLLELDADTRVHTALRLHHVTSLNPESGGVRLGCELVNPAPDGVRALQRYIDQTQKRRRLLMLE